MTEQELYNWAIFPDIYEKLFQEIVDTELLHEIASKWYKKMSGRRRDALIYFYQYKLRKLQNGSK